MNLSHCTGRLLVGGGYWLLGQGVEQGAAAMPGYSVGHSTRLGHLVSRRQC